MTQPLPEHAIDTVLKVSRLVRSVGGVSRCELSEIPYLKIKPPSAGCSDAQANAIQLDIPHDTPGAIYWAPHQFRPSVVMGRVQEGPLDQLSKLDTAPSTSDLTITLTKRLGSRSYIDVYYACEGCVGDASTEKASMVAMIVDLSFFGPQGSGGPRPCREHVEETLSNLYRCFNILAPLQGSAVARCGGLFSNGSTLYCLVFEDAGRLLTVDELFHSPALGDKLIWTVKAVHSGGVALWPSAWSKFCRNEKGEIKVVFFQNDVFLECLTGHSIYNDQTPEERLKGCCGSGEDLLMERLWRRG